MAILSFRHKELEHFIRRGNAAGIQAKHAGRLRLILGRLNVALEPRDMALPGLRLHPLAGDRKGTLVRGREGRLARYIQIFRR